MTNGQFTVQRQLLMSRKLATEILETGIKVVDLIAPYSRGGKIGLFGGAGVGKTVLIMELYQEYCNTTWWVFCICWCW